MEQGIPSPFVPKVSRKEITPEEMEQVKKLLGVKCLFIVADTEQHNCSAATCTGHDYTIETSGFSEEQLCGFFISMAEKILERELV